MPRKIKAVSLAVAAGLASSTLAAPPPPPKAVDPITAGVISGLAVEVFKGMAAAAAGEKRAQVRAAVKLTGPDSDDKAANSQVDVDDWVWEYYLDADTGKVEAPNAGKPHTAWARLHYHWKDNAWRPNDGDYSAKPGTGGYVDNFAWARKDTTPVAGNDNKTEAASVSAFFLDGEQQEVWSKHESEVVPKHKGAGEHLASDAGARAYFSPSAFHFDRIGDHVRITPAAGDTRFDLFQSTAALGPQAKAAVSPLFDGFHGLDAEVSGQITSDLVAGSLGHATLASSVAELTINGASLQLTAAEYDAIDPVSGLAKSDMQLLREYLSDPTAVQVLAPLLAQAGYVPEVTSRQVVMGTESLNPSGLPEDTAQTLGQAHFDGQSAEGVISQPLDMIGIVLGVSGSLERALNLAAATPGSAFGAYFASLANGADFTLDVNFASSSGAYAYSFDTITIPAPGPVTFAGLALLGAARRRRA